MEVSIAKALTDCRTAWAKFFNEHNLDASATTFTDGTPIWGWCLHHAELDELDLPIEDRINYILATKPREKARRFRNLRPVSKQSIKMLRGAWKEYEKTRLLIWDKYVKRGPGSWSIDEHVKARREAKAKYQKVLDAAHLADVPNHTWNEKDAR